VGDPDGRIEIRVACEVVGQERRARQLLDRGQQALVADACSARGRR
jgi:hypothetical protein